MNFLGIFTFNAPYLPWVLLGFTVLLNNQWPSGDLLGLVIGHVYYFLEDVYPRMQGSGGQRFLSTPGVLKRLFDDLERDALDPTLPDAVVGETHGVAQDAGVVEGEVLPEPLSDEASTSGIADTEGITGSPSIERHHRSASGSGLRQRVVDSSSIADRRETPENE